MCNLELIKNINIGFLMELNITINILIIPA